MKDRKRLGVALGAAVVLLAGGFQLSAEPDATAPAEAACFDIEQANDDANDAIKECRKRGRDSVRCVVSCNEDGQMVSTCNCFNDEPR